LSVNIQFIDDDDDTQHWQQESLSRFMFLLRISTKLYIVKAVFEFSFSN